MKSWSKFLWQNALCSSSLPVLYFVSSGRVPCKGDAVPILLRPEYDLGRVPYWVARGAGHLLTTEYDIGWEPCWVARGAGHLSQDRILLVVSYFSLFVCPEGEYHAEWLEELAIFSGQNTTCCFLLFCTVCPESEYHAEWLEGLAILLRTLYYMLFLTLLYCVSRGRVPCRVAGGSGHPTRHFCRGYCHRLQRLVQGETIPRAPGMSIFSKTLIQ